MQGSQSKGLEILDSGGDSKLIMVNEHVVSIEMLCSNGIIMGTAAANLEKNALFRFHDPLCFDIPIFLLGFYVSFVLVRFR